MPDDISQAPGRNICGKEYPGPDDNRKAGRTDYREYRNSLFPSPDDGKSSSSGSTNVIETLSKLKRPQQRWLKRKPSTEAESDIGLLSRNPYANRIGLRNSGQPAP